MNWILYLPDRLAPLHISLEGSILIVEINLSDNIIGCAYKYRCSSECERAEVVFVLEDASASNKIAARLAFSSSTFGSTKARWTQLTGAEQSGGG